ncbi:hypothetical protein [Vibrio crassostreae]|uniref:hypothetical protein n=1 Tax=Vibrio crassostreae TaxID=246167 RepID=UPI001B306DA9|nr:hypothetical protein [Vibrio crassostreae]
MFMDMYSNFKAKRAETKRKNKIFSDFEPLRDIIRKMDGERHAPEPLDTHSFPDWRWLREDDPKSKWLQWKSSGKFGCYYIDMCHLVEATLVRIYEGEDDTGEPVVMYCDDFYQCLNYGQGVFDLEVHNHKAILKIIELLKGLYAQN